MVSSSSVVPELGTYVEPEVDSNGKSQSRVDIVTGLAGKASVDRLVCSHFTNRHVHKVHDPSASVSDPTGISTVRPDSRHDRIGNGDSAGPSFFDSQNLLNMPLRWIRRSPLAKALPVPTHKPVPIPAPSLGQPHRFIKSCPWNLPNAIIMICLLFNDRA